MTGSTPAGPATFGEFLKFLRRRMQMTQQDLGIALGYSTAMVARLESGERLPDLAMMKTAYIEALGLEHEPQLADRLTKLAVAARGERQAPPVTSATPPVVPLSNLPRQLTQFVGRQREMADVTRMLSVKQLVTLTGSGGACKTRLAIEVGTTFVRAIGRSPLPAAFPDGGVAGGTRADH